MIFLFPVILLLLFSSETLNEFIRTLTSSSKCSDVKENPLFSIKATIVDELSLFFIAVAKDSLFFFNLLGYFFIYFCIRFLEDDLIGASKIWDPRFCSCRLFFYREFPLLFACFSRFEAKILFPSRKGVAYQLERFPPFFFYFPAF